MMAANPMYAFRIATLHTLTLLMALVILSVFNGMVLAASEVRVMIVFDAEGHRIEQLHRPGSRVRPLPLSVDNARTSDVTRKNGGKNSLPTIYWYAVDGTLLSTDTIVDPRVRHVPLVDSIGKNNTVRYTVVTSGVYLIAGPANATQVVVELPSLQAGVTNLDTVQWRLDLTAFP